MLSRLLSFDAPVAIAHRGGSKLRPENTLPAFAHAVSLGVDAVECDVHLSSDGEPVVIHDATLERTTDRGGAVSRLTARQLASVDAGAQFAPDAGSPYRGLGIGIPTLAEVLAVAGELPVVVEIKGTEVRTAERALDVIRNAGAEGRVVLGGFSHAVVSHLRSVAPAVVTSASRDEVRAALRWSWFGLAPRRAGYRLFQVPLRLQERTVLTRRFVRAARRARLPVQAWIVDDPGDMRTLIGWGVAGLISDRPDLAIAAVRDARAFASRA
jgi:glycerophosphoryl diester phosphodiesterase